VSVPHPVDQPLTRPLKIFAFDPMLGRDSADTISVDIANERLAPGPTGSRVRVVDYDGVRDRYLSPVDLEDPAVLMAGGLDPSEADPRFHQQMVYAVTQRVLGNFDRALGRRIDFKGRQLLLVPHAFRGTNAYYDPRLRAIFFGYFSADDEDPGENMPGQPVFTCLSHDIVAHEVTHALVHRLRNYSLEATNRDVLAFHEAFADIVAIFQHFSFPSVLREAIRRSSGNLRSDQELAALAAQFGHATGRGNALRSAIDRPDPSNYLTTTEPHERGSILVGAVFDGFFTAYQRRIDDLLRLGAAFDAQARREELHPALVDRLAETAARAAQTTLTMCIRAFEYLPPVDITFGDFLRALITADRDLLAEDGAEQRRAMIDAFRRRGIYPEDVSSLSEEALCWPQALAGIPAMPSEWVAQVLIVNAQDMQLHGSPRSRGEQREELGHAAGSLIAWAHDNAEVLGLSPNGGKISIQGFHGTFRVAPNGRLVVEVVARFTQWEDTRDAPEYGGLPFRGGTTVVAASSGDVRFVIAKPLASVERRERQLGFVESCDAADPALVWSDADYSTTRIADLDFRGLHQGMALR
jgi:hypothetical protein